MREYRSRFSDRYEFIDNNGLCVYCGEMADTQDHVIPLIVTYMMDDINKEYTNKIVLPACNHCNCIAGSKVFPSFHKRKEYIQSRLKIKLRKILDMKQWSESELSELSPNLRRYVENSVHARNRAERRINWRDLDNPAYARIAKLNSKLVSIGSVFVQMHADRTGTINSVSP